jgi:hypothetical protein
MTNAITESKRIADQIESGRIPPPSKAQAVVLIRQMVQLAEQLEDERKDAARYRWLKANHLQTGPDSWIRTGDDLEEAIDAEMPNA